MKVYWASIRGLHWIRGVATLSNHMRVSSLHSSDWLTGSLLFNCCSDTLVFNVQSDSLAKSQWCWAKLFWVLCSKILGTYLDLTNKTDTRRFTVYENHHWIPGQLFSAFSICLELSTCFFKFLMLKCHPNENINGNILYLRIHVSSSLLLNNIVFQLYSDPVVYPYSTIVIFNIIVIQYYSNKIL